MRLKRLRRALVRNTNEQGQMKTEKRHLPATQRRPLKNNITAPPLDALKIQLFHRTRLGQKCPQTRGFTLIEIMVVVVILGILAATIIPQFIGTTHDAKVSTARSNISELESAIERFYIHMDRYPSSEEGLAVLVQPPPGEEEKWRGPYVKMVRPDPWGQPFEYQSPGTHSATFDIWSRGADGLDGGEAEAADIGNWK